MSRLLASLLPADRRCCVAHEYTPAACRAESDAVAAVLGAEAAAAEWARRPAAGEGGAFSTLGGRPVKRQRGDHEWALK